MGAHKKILEINPNHPVVVEMMKKLSSSTSESSESESSESDKHSLSETAFTLYMAALVESGYELSDPSGFVSKIYGIMGKQLGVDMSQGVKEIEVPEEEEKEEVVEETVEEE